MASFGQPCTQLSHRMHSPPSMSALCTRPLTAKLIGQLRVQVWESLHLFGADLRRRQGQLIQLNLPPGVGRVLMGDPNSCNAPAGQAQPHHSRPTVRADKNIS